MRTKPNMMPYPTHRTSFLVYPRQLQYFIIQVESLIFCRWHVTHYMELWCVSCNAEVYTLRLGTDGKIRIQKKPLKCPIVFNRNTGRSLYCELWRIFLTKQNPNLKKHRESRSILTPLNGAYPCAKIRIKKKWNMCQKSEGIPRMFPWVGKIHHVHLVLGSVAILLLQYFTATEFQIHTVQFFTFMLFA